MNLQGKDAQVTVIAWIQHEHPAQWQAIAGVWDETRKKRQFCHFLNVVHGTRADKMKRYPLANRIHGHVSAVGGSTAGEECCITCSSGATEIPMEGCHCLAMTYDDLASRVYVDGKLDAWSTTTPFPIPTVSTAAVKTVPISPSAPSIAAANGEISSVAGSAAWRRFHGRLGRRR